MTLTRSLVSWLILLVVAVLNGATRDLVYAPSLGPHLANQVSCFTGIAFFAVAIWILLSKWPIAPGISPWRIGGLWFLLTVVFEFSLGAASGRTWASMLADYEIGNGRLWPVVLAWVLVAPYAITGARRKFTDGRENGARQISSISRPGGGRA